MNIYIKFNKAGIPRLIKNQSKLATLGLGKDVHSVFVDRNGYEWKCVVLQWENGRWVFSGSEPISAELPSNGIVRITIKDHDHSWEWWLDIDTHKVITPTPEMVDAYDNRVKFGLV